MGGWTKDGWRRRITLCVVVLAPGERCVDETVEPESPVVTLVGPDGLVQVEDHRLLVLPPLAPCEPGAPGPERLRVVTWNIATARESSLAEVAQVLRGLVPDVVVLQEVDVDAPRSFELDQPQELADALGYEHAFAASVDLGEGSFGLAVLSALPFAEVERVTLLSSASSEPRIALDVTLCAGEHPLRVVDVHADYLPEGNVFNLVDLGERLGSLERSATIVAGDLNAEDDDEGLVALLELTGAFDVLGKWDPEPTIDGARRDYVLVSPSLSERVTVARRVETDASDHMPLLVELDLGLAWRE